MVMRMLKSLVQRSRLTLDQRIEDDLTIIRDLALGLKGEETGSSSWSTHFKGKNKRHKPVKELLEDAAGEFTRYLHLEGYMIDGKYQVYTNHATQTHYLDLRVTFPGDTRPFQEVEITYQAQKPQKPHKYLKT